MLDLACAAVGALVVVAAVWLVWRQMWWETDRVLAELRNLS